MSEHNPLTVEQAAGELGVTARRVRAMIADERLPAEKVGRDWLIKKADLAKVKGRKSGRPRKGF